MGSHSVAGMLKLERSIVSMLARRFRSRAVVELENLALRHQTAPLSPPAAGSAPAVRDRPLALGLALPIVAALSGGDGVGQAGNGDPVAPSGIALVLALALELRAAVSQSASPGFDIDVSKVEYLVQGRAMSSALKKMEDDALKLPARSRARLAERLITSLEETAEPQAKREWLLEIERRAVELKSGKVKGIPAGKVFKKARAALR